MPVFFPRFFPANSNDSTQNFNSLHYAGICLSTFISRNRWKDLTSILGLLFWCKAKLALAKLVSQHHCSERDLNTQYKSLILPKFWANYCSNPNELLFLEKPHLGKHHIQSCIWWKLNILLIPHFIVSHLTFVTFKTGNKFISTSHPPALFFPITFTLFNTFICVVMPKNNRWAF